jgi:O-antigen ligase
MEPLLLLPLPWFYLLVTFKNWKLAYWILLATIPCSVRFTLANDTLAITLPDQPMMWLFLFLSLILIAHRPNTIPAWWWFNPIVIVVLLQFAWLVVAVINSKVLFFSIKFLIAKTWMLACFFLVPLWIFKEKKDYKIAFLLLLIPMVATMLIVIARHAVVDFRFADIKYAIAQVYYNHVEYSTVISMFFPLLIVAYPLIPKSNKKYRRILIALVVFFTLAIFLSYARAAILAVLFALIIGFAVRIRLVNFIMPAFYGLLALLLTYVVRDYNYMRYTPNYEQTFMHNDFADHISATFKGRDISSMERLYRWVAAIRMSTENPLVGFGPHGFYYHYKPYALSVFKTYVSNNEDRSTAHNYFLFTLVEQGFPAMVLYGLLIIVVFAQAQRTYHRFTDRFYKNCTLGLAMLFAASFVNNFFSEMIETHKVGSIFYLSLALLIVLDHKSRSLSVASKNETGSAKDLAQQ